MLLEQINRDIKDAMRNKEANKLLVLRTLKGEIQRKSDNPTDVDVLGVVKKSIEGVKETTNDVSEIAMLEVYLPAALTTEELTDLATAFLTENGLEGMGGLGKTMGYFKANYAGKYDGGELSTIVKSILGV